MTGEFIGASWTFFGMVVLAVLGIIGNYMVRRLRGRASEPDMWKRLDELAIEVYGDGKQEGLKQRLSAAESRADLHERKASAMGHVIRDLAGQWQGPPPRLNPRDLDLLDTATLPATHGWRRPFDTENERKEEP
jgi:hypothetical protein